MTVKSWGKGRPDYYKAAISSRPQVLEDSQVKWTQTTAYTINAGSVVIDTFYTIPDGYTLELGGGFVSCTESCINKLRLVTDSLELIGDFRFDVQGIIMFSATAGQTVPSGETITAYVYNNDALTATFSLTFSGVLVRT